MVKLLARNEYYYARDRASMPYITDAKSQYHKETMVIKLGCCSPDWTDVTLAGYYGSVLWAKLNCCGLGWTVVAFTGYYGSSGPVVNLAGLLWPWLAIIVLAELLWA